MDDIFSLFDNPSDISCFLEYVKLTVELEVEGKLPYVDVLINPKTGEHFVT